MSALPIHEPQRTIPDTQEGMSDEDLVKIFDGYRKEAEDGRRSGPAPRDTVWEANWDRYWGKYDNTKKAPWQSTYVMPEAPQYIDRWAAAMREALDTGGEWFGVEDETGQNGPLMPHVTKLMKVLLGRCSITPDGHQADFSSVFEDQMKMGALMQLCASVTWDESRQWPTVASVDPREVWVDPKLRHLYRRRRYMIDKHELRALAKEADGNGDKLYNETVIAALLTSIDEIEREKEQSSGHSSGGQPTTRQEIQIEEWLATVVDNDGDVVVSRGLTVIANDRFAIRGPEENPFWHDTDWIVSTPLIPVPFSAYGRTYMEDWADVADAFVEMTRLILDGTFTSTLKAFAATPSMLNDPSQLANGIAPNTIFQLSDEGTDIKNFLKEIDLGTLPAESFQVWQALKQELRDGAKLSEIALGQLAPKQGTTATEISTVSQSGSAMVRSMARTVESRFVEPVLTLVYQTALQHMDFTALASELGEETAMMLQARKEEFRDLKIKFRVRGISSIVDRQSQLRNMLALLQLVAQNELLFQEFVKNTSMRKTLNKLFQLFGIDMADLQLTKEEQAVEALTAQPAPVAPGAAPA